MRLAALALLLAASSAQAQWTRVDANYGIADAYATNVVGSNDTHVFATVLAGQPSPSRFLILRSPDDGASWQQVFSGYNGGVRGNFIGDVDGRMMAVVVGGGLTAVLVSPNGGATWAETPARIPSQQSTAVARMGETYVVVGPNPSYRSTNGGSAWTTFGQNQPMVSVFTFGGGFYALDGIGRLYTLTGDTWAQIAFNPPLSFATDAWVEGGKIWAKASGAALFSSPDGATWTAQPTAAPTQFNLVRFTPDDARPWLLHSQAATLDLRLSDNQGATSTSIAAGYPRDDNGGICTSNYALTRRSVFGNAWGCSFTDLSRNGLFRYTFGGGTATGDAPETGAGLTVGPNPTRGAATARITLGASVSARVTVQDVLGREVAALHDGPLGAGEHAFALPAGLAPGVYVVRALAGGVASARTLTVVR